MGGAPTPPYRHVAHEEAAHDPVRVPVVRLAEPAAGHCLPGQHTTRGPGSAHAPHAAPMSGRARYSRLWRAWCCCTAGLTCLPSTSQRSLSARAHTRKLRPPGGDVRRALPTVCARNNKLAPVIGECGQKRRARRVVGRRPREEVAAGRAEERAGKGLQLRHRGRHGQGGKRGEHVNRVREQRHVHKGLAVVAREERRLQRAQDGAVAEDAARGLPPRNKAREARRPSAPRREL